MFTTGLCVLASAIIKQEKNIKMHTDQTVELKFSLFAEDIIKYVENLQNEPKNKNSQNKWVQQICRIEDEQTEINSNEEHAEIKIKTQHHLQSLWRKSYTLNKWHSNKMCTGYFMHCTLKIAKCWWKNSKTK